MRPVGLQEQVLGQLLGQRRAALGEAPAACRLVDHGARQADRIDAEMRIEAAVLDGHHRLRDIGRHFVQADGLAAGHAAIGKQLAIDRDDLDVGRAVGDRPGRGRRHLGAVIDDDAGGGDAAPDAPARRSSRTAGRNGRTGRTCGGRPGPWPCRFAAGLRRAACLRPGTTRSSSVTDRPRAALLFDAVSKVGSMRLSFRFAMKPISRPRDGNRVQAKCGDLRWG